MFKEFRDFLIKDNALALAVGVIIGAAMGKLVGSITDDLIMPLVGLVMPANASWQTWGIELAPDKVLKIGSFLAALVNLCIIGFVCFLLIKIFVPKKPA
jgi:large conductance mechanosensitive channel